MKQSRALTTYLSGHQWLITFTNNHGRKCNIDSAHQFLQFSILAEQLTEARISSTSDTSHLQFTHYTLNSYFVTQTDVYALDNHLVDNCQLDFYNHEFQLLQLGLRLLSTITIVLFIVLQKQ